MQAFDTILGRFFPTVFGDETEEGFDLWRLPNEPDSPHVSAMRDLFAETFRMRPSTFDAQIEPV